MVTLIVQTYEPSRKYAIVEHIFRGETKQEAIGYYNAHLRSDIFLRECTETGLFDGRVRCHSKMKWMKK